MKVNSNISYMAKVKFFTIAAVIISGLTLFFAFKDDLPEVASQKQPFEQLDRWELPSQLREISGLVWLEDNKLAAVQDEDGIIFIYDLIQRKVVEEIPFGPSGDYEGIAISGTTAYVLRSDGAIIEIADYKGSNRKTTTYNTPFSEENNMETLFFDAVNNQLLIAPKDSDFKNKGQKGIYAFNLKNNELNTVPIFSIAMTDAVLKSFVDKDLENTFRPSDLAIHPITGEIYILEGANPKLMIMDRTGKLKKVHALPKNQFLQPEGITFSPDGKLYISSEGKKKGKGTITQLRFRH